MIYRIYLRDASQRVTDKTVTRDELQAMVQDDDTPGEAA